MQCEHQTGQDSNAGSKHQAQAHPAAPAAFNSKMWRSNNRALAWGLTSGRGRPWTPSRFLVNRRELPEDRFSMAGPARLDINVCLSCTALHCCALARRNSPALRHLQQFSAGHASDPFSGPFLHHLLPLPVAVPDRIRLRERHVPSL
jgi:hypothetical protein